MIAIIKYNAGNITSVQNAIYRLGYTCLVTDDVQTIRQADKIIFPGVGAAGAAMQYLKEKGLDSVIKNSTQPFLGICLGMQLMCRYSAEDDTTCLGIFDTKVHLFPPEDKVPHMGWNTIANLKGQLFQNIREQNDVYFVHSYYAQMCEDTIATCNYIRTFSAALQKNNFYATQFHPEKSATIGHEILKNFLTL